jgi:hypothetical protein
MKGVMPVTQLIYVSTMLGENERELASILESSVRHNLQNGITGMLLYYRGGYMQVLEGGEAQVHETYARICADPRHHHILTLTDSEVQMRHFENWSMGYKFVEASTVAMFPRFAPLFNFRTQADQIKGVPGLAMDMMKMFSNDMKLEA